MDRGAIFHFFHGEELRVCVSCVCRRKATPLDNPRSFCFDTIAILGDNMKIKYFAVALLAASVTSCAKRPDSIAPVDIPMAAYTPQDCPALQTELSKERALLAAVSAEQHSAANGDAFGVFLVGVPVSSTFGATKKDRSPFRRARCKLSRMR